VKISLNIPDSIYKQLKKRAALESGTIADVILRAIEHCLEEGEVKTGRRAKLPIVRSKRPGKLKIDNSKIYKLIEFP
jgi:hypothetical protein